MKFIRQTLDKVVILDKIIFRQRFNCAISEINMERPSECCGYSTISGVKRPPDSSP